MEVYQYLEVTVASQTYRLVTRSDFDGLVCAVLLKELSMIDDILFVHPKDMQDGTIKINQNDITTNLPYVEGCLLSFDHHASELKRRGNSKPANHIIDEKAPSAARVVYDYYGGKDKFPNISDEIMSWLIHEIGHIEFYKGLGEKLDEYMEEYHKKGEYTDSEMEKSAFKSSR